MASDRHVLMYHGTTDAFLESIVEKGFLPAPDLRPSHIAGSGDENHLMSSLDGVYMAATRETSEWHARSAARKFGGEPMMFVLRVPLDLLVPDEDEVHCMLTAHLYRAMGYDFDTDYDDLPPEERTPWSAAAALTAAATLLGRAKDDETVEEAAMHLDAMISLVCGPAWDRDPEFFHPEAQDGWNCPNWLVELDATAAGRTAYRAHMDAFCRLLAGMDPHEYSCGMESCRARVVSPFRIDADEGIVVVGYGPLSTPFGFYSRTEVMDGSEERYRDDDVELEIGRQASLNP